jgi:hypothetical protein
MQGNNYANNLAICVTNSCAFHPHTLRRPYAPETIRLIYKDSRLGHSRYMVVHLPARPPWAQTSARRKLRDNWLQADLACIEKDPLFTSDVSVLRCIFFAC